MAFQSTEKSLYREKRQFIVFLFNWVNLSD